MELSLILPVFNEASVLEKNATKTVQYLKGLGISFEIIIAEDGSTDGTDLVAKKLEHTYKSIRAVCVRNKLGRGRAIKNAAEIANGKKLIYIDIDLPIRIEEIKKMLNHLDRYDIVIGSRYNERSKVRRTTIRYLLSSMYVTSVKMLFGDRIKDFQCGFKGFRPKVLRELNKEVKSESYFWDTEIILKACRRGFSLLEMPVHWTEKESFRKLDSEDIVSRIKMLKELILLKLEPDH